MVYLSSAIERPRQSVKQMEVWWVKAEEILSAWVCFYVKYEAESSDREWEGKLLEVYGKKRKWTIERREIERREGFDT